MDYITQPLHFRLRKALRYVRLYGLRRTVVKVESHYHMRRKYSSLPPRGRVGTEHESHVAIVGCGKFAYSTIAYYLKRNYGEVMRAAMDIDIHRAASLHQKYGLAYYTDDITEILDDDHIDLVFIASNHASHAEYAIQALARGKSVHIEKPHVVSRDQLVRLCGAMEHSEGGVFLGFNRPLSPVGLEIAASLASQEGPGMYTWFVAGHEIPPDHWYFKEEEGGRILGNLCHWTDFCYRLVESAQRFPVEIVPARANASESDISVSYVFGEGSVASIAFSAKGHTFEGVREVFSGHRGDVLIAMKDFKDLKVDVGARRKTHHQLYRNHGHEARIKQSYEEVARPQMSDGLHRASPAYVWETGELFLETKQALDRQEIRVTRPYRPGMGDTAT